MFRKIAQALFWILAIILAVRLIGLSTPTSWLSGWTITGGGHAQVYRPGVVYIQAQAGDEVPSPMPVIYPPAVTPSPTSVPSVTVTPPAVTAPLAWNCQDWTNIVSDDVVWYWEGTDNPVLCVDPVANSFEIAVINARATDVMIVSQDHSVTIALNPGQVGCINDTLVGCRYTVSVATGTFGSLADSWGVDLVPVAPELGRQGIPLRIHLEFVAGIHSIIVP